MRKKRKTFLKIYNNKRPAWRIKDPRELVAIAIREGRLIRPDRCEECGYKCQVEGHHEDYSKPLEVRWLCRGCHTRETYRIKRKCLNIMQNNAK